MRILFFLTLLLTGVGSLSAQMEAPKNWWNLDKGSENYPGVSADKALDYLEGRTAQTVVVAVIDSGVDVEHEDLKDVVWINEDEIPNNGRDDDNNGYVDDVHGWNFLGGADGQNVEYENLELVRLYNKYKKKYANRNPEGLPKEERKEYEAMMEYEMEIEAEQEKWAPQLVQLEPLYELLEAAKEKIAKPLEDITDSDVKKLNDAQFGAFKNIAARFMTDQSFASFYNYIHDFKAYVEEKVKYNYNPDFDARYIVGDDPSNLSDRIYGNNDVEGPDASHGTHVAGIIAAARNNGIGVDGVGGANIRIMAIRAVPNGDERDKDVANAIRYAVDNGASVINMSFGKGQSPYKEAVDEAIKYAEKNDVLLVHAAGNDGKELTLTNNFPNDVFSKKGFLKPKSSRVWLEVGAASKNYDEQLAADFSNYNGEYVDVFAPGVDIYSATPGDKYDSFSGTSMAAPMVAGVAGMLRAYFPDLTARQVREIILESAIPANLEVVKPGSDADKVAFNRLSQTGALANAYAAIKMAEQTKGKKKKTADRDPALAMY